MKDPKNAVIQHFIPKGQMQYDIIISVERTTNADNGASVKLSIKPISIYLDNLEYVEEVSKKLYDADKVFDDLRYALENNTKENKMIDIRYCGVGLVHMIMSIRYQDNNAKYVAMDFVLSADDAKVRRLFGNP